MMISTLDYEPITYFSEKCREATDSPASFIIDQKLIHSGIIKLKPVFWFINCTRIYDIFPDTSLPPLPNEFCQVDLGPPSLFYIHRSN